MLHVQLKSSLTPRGCGLAIKCDDCQDAYAGAGGALPFVCAFRRWLLSDADFLHARAAD